MNKYLLSSLSLLLNTGAIAQTLLVSDVDDTIKVSHVLDLDSVLANVPMVRNAFIGMPELYQQISSLPEVTAVKYLSNAPQGFVADIHKTFLRINHFPSGDLLTRNLSDIRTGNAHKLNSLRSFIGRYQPRSLILIGDNGEADAEIYHQISQENPTLPILTYIRQAYSSLGYENSYAKPLQEGQIPFVSSIDIALDLYAKGILTSEVVSEHIRKIAPLLIKESYEEERGQPMGFPEWYDCRDFKLPKIPVLMDVKAQNLLTKYSYKVNFRCSREPFDD